MNRGPAKLFWQVIDRFEYAVTSMRLAIVDRVYGPDPPTQADRQREAEKERLQRAFPAINIDCKQSEH